jgi:hypothetical protein
MGFDCGAGEGFAMQRRGGIVADLADVARAQPPLRARDDRSRNLAAGQHAHRGVLGF